MKILFISSSKTNDLYILNIIYSNLIASTVVEIEKSDLVLVKPIETSNIFFDFSMFDKVHDLSVSKNFFSGLRLLNTKGYDYLIQIGSDASCWVLRRILKVKIKIKGLPYLKSLFRDNTVYDEPYVNTTCTWLLNQLQSITNGAILKPKLFINKQVYATTYEMVNWFLKSSHKMILGNSNFCFLYIDSTNTKVGEELEGVTKLLRVLVSANIYSIIIYKRFKESVANSLIPMDIVNHNLLVKNFSDSDESSLLYFFLKQSKFIVTNNESVKIASACENKKCLHYSSESMVAKSENDFLMDFKSVLTR